MPLVSLSALLCLFIMASPAMAGTVYKCTDAHGHVTYRDTPCAAGHRQQVMHFANAPPTPASPPPTAVAQPPPPAPPPAPTQRVTRAPPPVLYRCMRATDGSTYLSRSGRTRSYLAPLAMLGGISRPLAEVYGSLQGKGVGMSAPELMPDPTPGMIGGYYVRVHDVCRRLPPRAACAALRKQYEDNEEAIRKAFESDRAPLRKRRQQLRTQLAGCH